MQPIHIIAILVRLFAVWLFINSIERVALLFIPTPVESSFYLLHIAAISELLGSIILWNFPTLISKKLVPLEPNSLTHDKLSLNDWYRLAFVTLGIFLLLQAISDSFYWLTYMHFLKEQNISYVFSEDTPENKASITSTAFEFALAVVFIFSSKHIISLIRSTKVKI